MTLVKGSDLDHDVPTESTDSNLLPYKHLDVTALDWRRLMRSFCLLLQTEEGSLSNYGKSCALRGGSMFIGSTRSLGFV